MLSKNEFNTLLKFFKNEKDIDDIKLKELENGGYIINNNITEQGFEELNKHKVDNAIIMAAGLSSRFAPLSYENPKGLLNVKGEILIERQIKQLKEAGITDITVVVGYMMEKFFYLEDKFGVNIVVNEEYNKRNNNSTLYLVKNKLRNTYICSSDNYFTKNVFESYVYRAYYSAVYEAGKTDEYCIATNDEGRIIDVKVTGEDTWTMLGHVYFDKAFSDKFVEILVRDYDKVETASKLWEDIYIDNISELEMYIKKYDKSEVLEFDSLDDLRFFDSKYINNTDSKILSNICGVLNCEEQDIRNIVPIKKGLTNTSFTFEVKNKKYVYRHPGAGTEEIINRASEAFSQEVAKELEIDDTFIYMSAKEGFKVSRFVDNCRDFDYRNNDDVRKGLKLVRKLHEAKVDSKWEFNIFIEAEKLVEILTKKNQDRFSDFNSLREVIGELYKLTELDNVQKVLCHNDCYDPNFLTDGKEMYLIDWEYSGKSDPASDLGTFICCSDYTVEEAKEVLEIYFDRTLTLQEEKHYLAYVAICSYYWFVWALYKESVGETIGEYLYLWYKYAKSYGKLALDLYRK